MQPIGTVVRNTSSLPAFFFQEDKVMTTRAYIAFVLVLMVNAVMFGAGAIMVLSVPALSERAPYLLPAVVAISTIVSPLLAWAMASTLRARRNRSMDHPQTYPNQRASF